MLLFWLVFLQVLLYLLGCGKKPGYLGCGNFGFSGKEPAEVTKVRWLAVENQSRGIHSTGVFTVGSDNGKTQTLFKDAIPAKEFINKLGFQQAVKGATLVIGHTRAATAGSVCQFNAHPFEYDIKEKVIGAHNGFVMEDVTRKKFDLKGHFAVDSMMIFHLLSREGGDYKLLPEIEGGIAMAYAMPDKYPGSIFLYKRSARDLHLGRSKEGIYYSSEKEPLTFIGCSEITPILDDYLVVLRNGEIIDMVELKPPKIKVPHGAGRDNWKYRIDKPHLEEVEAAYPDLKEKRTEPIFTNYATRGSTKHVMGFQQKGHYPTPMSTDGIKDINGMLIAMIKTEVKFITSKEIPEASVQESYKPGDFESSLLVGRLTSSKDVELIGWLVYDEEDEYISCTSAVNGVFALKYDMVQCRERTLVIADPIDGKTKWKHKFTPEAGRVVEVTLQLPFPEKEEKSPTSNQNIYIQEVRETLVENGGAQLSLLPASIKLHGGLLSAEGLNREILSFQKEQVGKRHSEFEATRGQEEGNDSGVDVSHITDRSQTHGRTIIPPKLGRADLALILEDEFRTFAFKDEVKGFMHTTEWSKFTSYLNKHIGKLIQVPMLASDASTIAFHQKRKNGTSFSMAVYAMQLLEFYMQKYMINKRSNPEEIQILYAFIKTFRTYGINGPFEYEPSKKKEGLTDKERKMISSGQLGYGIASTRNY